MVTVARTGIKYYNIVMNLNAEFAGTQRSSLRDFPRRPSAILLVPPSLAAIADGLLTVAGQPDGYLSGDASTVREWNPVARYLLSFSPWAFAIGICCWIAILCITIFLLRDRNAVVLSLFVCAAHLVGVSTWLIRYPYGILWVFLLWICFRFTLFRVYQRGLRSAE